jgi:vitamin B12 transporter
MSYLKTFLFLVINLFFVATCPGNHQNQKIEVRGTILNEKNEPLAFANIFLKGSMEGTISNESGEFSFKTLALGKVTLFCSYIGYTQFEKEFELKKGSILDVKIQLQQEFIKGKQVMVTASAFTAADEEGVTLTAMDVVRTPGAAADLFWAIKSFPGLQQVEEGAGLFVRGGDVSENVVLLDGAIINHPYKFESPTGGFFGTFSPFLLKGTFFSSGGFSAQYGNALSGALSMESYDLPNQRRMGIGIGLAAESIFLSTPIVENKFGFSLSGNRSNTKMMFELNKNRKDFSEYPSSYDINLNAVYKMDKNSKLKLFVFRETDKVGVEVDDPDYNTHFHGSTSNQLYNTRYTSLVNKKYLIQANLAFNNFQRETNLGVMDLDIKDRLYQSRITAEREILAGATFRFGLAFYRYQTLISGFVAMDELDLSPQAPIYKVDTDYVSDRTVQFVEFEFFAPMGIKVISGLRGEHESVTKQYQFDPRISFLYALNTHSNLTASWGIFHQYPDPSRYDPYVGNPKLTSMNAKHYIVGYAFQKDNTIFRLEGYYKKYQNLLLENDKINYSNEGHGYATGIDVFVKNSFGPFSGWCSYSWLKARRKWMDLPVLVSPYFDITNNFTLVLNIDLPKNITLGSSFRFATGKPYTPAPEKYHESRVPSYQKLDLTFSYLHSFFESNMTVLYFSFSNILGRINIFDYRYSTDFERRDAVESSFGRSVYFGFQFNL